MILTAFEQEAYDKGVKETIENQKPKWIKQGIKEGEQKMLNKMIKSLQKKDPSLSNIEALEQIKKEFNLE